MEIYKNLDKHFIKYGKHNIAIIFDKYDKIWFNAKETALSLGYTNTKKVVRAFVPPQYKKQLKYIKTTYKKGQPKSLYLSEPGLYRLMIRSHKPESEKFVDWIVEDILPSIRKYGEYKLKKKYDTEFKKLSLKITFLEKTEKELRRDLTKEIFPKGCVFYVIDYSTEDEEIYRIGITCNMEQRKKLHDTHSLHKREAVIVIEIDCPSRLEKCVQVMLHDFRYKNKKDYYLCSYEEVKDAVDYCEKGILKGCSQEGGSNSSQNTSMITPMIINLKEDKIILRNKIIKVTKKLNED